MNLVVPQISLIHGYFLKIVVNFLFFGIGCCILFYLLGGWNTLSGFAVSDPDV